MTVEQRKNIGEKNFFGPAGRHFFFDQETKPIEQMFPTGD